MAPEAWTFAIGRSDVSVPIHSRLVVNTAEAAIDAAIAGVGITRVLSYQIATATRAGTLAIALQEFEPARWPAIVTQVDRKSHLMTDEAPVYTKTGEEFAGHSTVNHSIEEYVRHGGFTHTNTIEGYFSILKRGVYGTYHHVSAAHLKRYLCEFDFRYNERSAHKVTDTQRFTKAMKGIVGKRLTYRRTGERANVQA
jgi:hypothetical protein